MKTTKNMGTKAANKLQDRIAQAQGYKDHADAVAHLTPGEQGEEAAEKENWRNMPRVYKVNGSLYVTNGKQWQEVLYATPGEEDNFLHRIVTKAEIVKGQVIVAPAAVSVCESTVNYCPYCGGNQIQEANCRTSHGHYMFCHQCGGVFMVPCED